MFRLLLLIGIGYLVYQLLRPKIPKKSRSGGRSGAGSPVGEKMVKCAACGLYVPEHEALRGGPGKGCFYCSEQCRAGRG